MTEMSHQPARHAQSSHLMPDDSIGRYTYTRRPGSWSVIEAKVHGAVVTGSLHFYCIALSGWAVRIYCACTDDSAMLLCS